MKNEKPSYGFFEDDSDEIIAVDAERLAALLEGIADEMDKSMMMSDLHRHLWNALKNQLRASSDTAKAIAESCKYEQLPPTPL